MLAKSLGKSTLEGSLKRSKPSTRLTEVIYFKLKEVICEPFLFRYLLSIFNRHVIADIQYYLYILPRQDQLASNIENGAISQNQKTVNKFFFHQNCFYYL